VPYVLSVPENLVLHAQNGAIAVDVWVTGNNKLRLVSMKLVSDDGNVDARVVCLPRPEFLVKNEK
jgi:hypothetical protein